MKTIFSIIFLFFTSSLSLFLGLSYFFTSFGIIIFLLFISPIIVLTLIGMIIGALIDKFKRSMKKKKSRIKRFLLWWNLKPYWMKGGLILTIIDCIS